MKAAHVNGVRAWVLDNADDEPMVLAESVGMYEGDLSISQYGDSLRIPRAMIPDLITLFDHVVEHGRLPEEEPHD